MEVIRSVAGTVVSKDCSLLPTTTASSKAGLWVRAKWHPDRSERTSGVDGPGRRL